VKDVRVLGLIGVVEIENDWEKMIELRKKFIQSGVFLRPFAGCIYLMPPLNIKRAELKKITEAILEVTSSLTRSKDLKS
jgi:adenosylmethionine-8-amino-7-oxononanoate aminotransferase